MKEAYTIDRNTGEIQNKTVTSGEPSPDEISNHPMVNVFQFPTIDIEAIKRMKPIGEPLSVRDTMGFRQ